MMTMTMTFEEALALKAEIDQAPGWLVIEIARHDDGYYPGDRRWTMRAAYWPGAPDPINRANHIPHHNCSLTSPEDWPPIRERFEREWPLRDRWIRGTKGGVISVYDDPNHT